MTDEELSAIEQEYLQSYPEEFTCAPSLIAEVRRLKADQKKRLAYFQETITKLERRLELAENVCRLICAAGLHKQHMDNLLDAMNAWIKERDE